MDAGGGIIRDRREANAAWTLSGDLHGTDHEHFAPVAASSPAGNGFFLGSVWNCGLIYFHRSTQQVTAWIDHGVAELGGQEPSTLVGTEPELGLQLPSRDAVRVGRHQVGGPKPYVQGQLAAVHDGPGPHRCLPTAAMALESPGLGPQRPGAVVPAARAAEPIRPAHGNQIGRTGGLAGKPPFKGNQGTWKIGQDGDLPITCLLFVLITRPRKSHQHIVAPDVRA